MFQGTYWDCYRRAIKGDYDKFEYHIATREEAKDICEDHLWSVD